MIKIRNTNPTRRVTALMCIDLFDTEFPDRMGLRDGVGYFIDGHSYYVYRTKTQVVVVGDD